jgi:hypothetical protein
MQTLEKGSKELDNELMSFLGYSKREDSDLVRCNHWKRETSELTIPCEWSISTSIEELAEILFVNRIGAISYTYNLSGTRNGQRIAIGEIIYSDELNHPSFLITTTITSYSSRHDKFEGSHKKSPPLAGCIALCELLLDNKGYKIWTI